MERGVITARELEAFVGPEWEDDPTPRFAAGDVVQVKAEDTATRFRKVCRIQRCDRRCAVRPIGYQMSSSEWKHPSLCVYGREACV